MSRKARSSRGTTDVHDRIKATAERLDREPVAGTTSADAVPDLADLMGSAINALRARVPATFEHEGRTYWLRCFVAAHLEIFDAPTTARPLVRGLKFSTEKAGHVPTH